MLPKVAKGVPQKVVSFKAYEAKEKCRIQSAYPFLSPTQIKGKIRDRWNKLRDEEKQNYTSYKLEKSPPKKTDMSSKKRKSSSNLQFPKPKAKKLELHDLNTKPEVESIKSHGEANTKKVSVINQAPTGSGSSPVFKDKISTYQTHGNIGMKEKTPDCKKNSAPGILKTSDSAKKLQKARVSFNSPVELNNFEAETDPIDSHMENTNELDDSDDDDEQFLIRREDTEYLESTGTQTIAKEEKNISGNNEEETFHVLEGKNNDANIGDEFEADMPEAISKKIDLKQTRTSNSFSANSTKKRRIADCGAPQDTKDLFKSPLPNSTKAPKTSSKKKKLTTTGVSKQTPDMGQIKDQHSSQITPLVSHSMQDTDEYTTPQMDEVLQQLTLDQALKAPQKHRQSRGSANEREKIQAQLVGRHVNRSLLSPNKIRSVVDKEATGVENVKPAQRRSKGAAIKDDKMESAQERGRQSRSNKKVKKLAEVENICPKEESPVKSKVSRLSRERKMSDDHANDIRCDNAVVDAFMKNARKSPRVKKKSNDTFVDGHNIKMDTKNEKTRKPTKDANMRKNTCDKSQRIDAEIDTPTETRRRSARTRRPSNDASGKDKSDDAEADTRHFSSMTNQPNTEYSNSMMNDGLIVCDMNPSGDAGGNSSVVGVKGYMKLTKKSRKYNLSRKEVESPSSNPISTDDSLPPSSTDASLESSPQYFNRREVSDLKKTIEGRRGRNNPVLERALKLLQLTSNNATDSKCADQNEQVDEDEKMASCSPGILSPALSGVSELSSVSSSSSRIRDDTDSILHLQVNVKGFSHLNVYTWSDQLCKSSQGTQESGLCQLFKDLTPPEQKTRGLYKTKRLLTSSSGRDSVTLKDFVNEDTDIFA